jgi:hypothetical protein
MDCEFEMTSILPSTFSARYRAEFGTPFTWAESANAMLVGTDAVAAEPSGVSVLGAMAWWGDKLGMLDPASLASGGYPA